MYLYFFYPFLYAIFLGYGENGQLPIVPPKAKLRYEIELLAASDMAQTVEQGIQFALNKKKEGTELLKKNQYELGLHSYLTVNIQIHSKIKQKLKSKEW